MERVCDAFALVGFLPRGQPQRTATRLAAAWRLANTRSKVTKLCPPVRRLRRLDLLLLLCPPLPPGPWASALRESALGLALSGGTALVPNFMFIMINCQSVGQAGRQTCYRLLCKKMQCTCRQGVYFAQQQRHTKINTLFFQTRFIYKLQLAHARGMCLCHVNESSMDTIIKIVHTWS